MEKILVAIDFSAQSEYLLEQIADLRKVGIKEVVLVNIVEADSLSFEAREHGMEQFADLRSYLELSGFKVSISLRWGNPATEIQAVAVEEKADFIITASQGKQYIRKALVGSTSLELVKIATVPVLIEPDKNLISLGDTSEHFKKIMVPTDFSLASLAALDILKNMRASIGEVLFVNIVENKKNRRKDIEKEIESAKRNLSELVEEMSGFSIKASYLIDKGHPSKKIISMVHEQAISMIILPKTGGSVMENLLLGSTAQEILMAVNLPVMMVPTDLGR